MATTWMANVHAVVHVLIFFGFMVAMVLVPRALASLMHVSTVTFVSASASAAFSGMTHLGLALSQEDSTVFTIADCLQAVCVLAFVAALSYDLADASARLQRAFIAFGVKYGDEESEVIADTLRRALDPKADRTGP